MKLFLSKINKFYLILMIVLQLASIISTIYVAKIIGDFADSITNNTDKSINLLIIAIAIIFLHYLLMIFVFYMESKIVLEIKWFLLAKKIKTSKTFDEAMNEVNIYVHDYILSIVDLFWSFVILIISSVFIAVSSLITSAIVILLIILAMFSTLIFSKKIKKLRKYNLENESKYSYEIFKAEENIDTISLTMEEVIKASEIFSDNKRKISSKLGIFYNIKKTISGLFLGIITIAVTLSLAFSIYYGNSTVGDVITVITILSSATIYIADVSSNMSNIKNNKWIKEKKDIPEYNFTKINTKERSIKKIELKNISKKIGTRTILKRFSWTFKNGDNYLVKGDNGAGKTTFVKILAGLDQEYDGKIIVNNNHNKMSYLLDSVYYQTTTTKLIDAEFKKIINSRKNLKILKIINRKDLLQKKFNQLSSGEIQIIKVLSTINSNASIKIYDELFSNLDKKTKENLLKIVLMEKGINLIISHNIYLNKHFTGEIIFQKEG